MTTRASRDVMDMVTRPVTDFVLTGTGVSSIDSTPIGVVSPEAGTFTNLRGSNLRITASADFAGAAVTDFVLTGTGVSSIDSTPIGANTPAVGTFTSLQTTSLTVGNTADFTGATVIGLAGSNSDLVDDLTPQLGGDLDTNGHAVYWSKGTNVVSASTLNILTNGNSFTVTGGTTINRIEPIAGAFGIGSIIMLRFTSALTLAHSAASLGLLGDANITVAAGDVAIFQKNTNSMWEMVSLGAISTTIEWQTGSSNKPSLVSPANIAAAIAAQSSSIGAAVDTQTFVTSGNWTKPSTGSICRVQLWGGGGGGGSDLGNSNDGGGGGGSYYEGWVVISELAATVPVTVGIAGTPGNNGSQSQFAYLLASGGQAGNNTRAGYGSTMHDASGLGTIPGNNVASGNAGDSIPTVGWAGGSGGGSSRDAGGGNGGDGGSSHWGGGGGGGSHRTSSGSIGTGGNSLFGGDGGDGGRADLGSGVVGTAGATPGGGGGTAQPGGSGTVIVTVY